jgi:hypothetical protein
MSGKHQWNVKADILCEPLKAYASQFPDDPGAAVIVADTCLGNAFYNVAKYILRDLSKGPDAALETSWESPDKSMTRTYTQYLMASYFELPVSDFKNKEEEEVFTIEA